MKKIVSAFVMLIVATMLFSGLASAEINFTANDDSELTDADFDITSGGVYTTTDKVVFWMEVRGQINLNPNENCTTDYTIDMYLTNNQEVKLEVTVYNYYGNRQVIADLSVGGSSINTLVEGKDYVVSGNKLSFYIDKNVANLGNLDNSDIDEVYFSAGKVCSNIQVATDEMYWSPSGGSDSGGSNTGPGPDVMAGFALLGFGYFICVGIWLIIAIVLALWAYKDAKSKCMSNPALWFVIVFFLGLIGLIIYIVVRKDECNKQPQETYYQAPPPPPQ